MPPRTPRSFAVHPMPPRLFSAGRDRVHATPRGRGLLARRWASARGRDEPSRAAGNEGQRFSRTRRRERGLERARLIPDLRVAPGATCVCACISVRADRRKYKKQGRKEQLSPPGTALFLLPQSAHSASPWPCHMPPVSLMPAGHHDSCTRASPSPPVPSIRTTSLMPLPSHMRPAQRSHAVPSPAHHLEPLPFCRLTASVHL